MSLSSPALAPAPRARPIGSFAPVVGFSDRFGGSGEGAAHQIEAAGIACLTGVITDAWLEEARTYIASQIPMNGTHEVLIEGFASGGDTFADRLLGDQRLQVMLDSVVAAGGPSRARGDCATRVDLRLVNGPGPAGKPPGFHYDGSVVTMVIPIVMPEGASGHRGELVLSPNRRPYRRSVVTNVVEKSLTQNDMYRRRFVRAQRTGDGVKIVDLAPGNAYLFWGYRSYHATLPCPAGTLRATLIVHYGNAHRESALLGCTMALGRRLREINRAATHGAGSYRVLTGAA